MIEELKWDSDFFGYRVGRIKLNHKKELDLKKLKVAAREYRLVYVMSTEQLTEINNFKLVDSKVIFTKPLAQKEINTNGNNRIVEFDPEIHSYSQLKELALLSGISSRFQTDINFHKGEFQKLYTKWLDRSISKDIAFSVLIRLMEKKVTGFVTLGSENKNVAQIGLIAVSEKFQGQKIGSALIKHCESISVEKGFSYLNVATQKENHSAMKFYHSNDFNIKKVEYIYHYWNL